MNTKLISWESVGCNICKSERFQSLFKDIKNWEFPEHFQIVRCTSCGLVYLNPRPKIKYISRFYPKKIYWKSKVFKNYKKERKRKYNHIYRYIFKKYSRDRILDVGAGTGLFLTKFKEEGWKIYGLEISGDAAKDTKRNYDIALDKKDIISCNYNTNNFKIISFNNSLEHIYNPLANLRHAYRLLRKDGVLILTVPNFGSIGRKIFNNYWYSLDPPRHLYHFSKKTIRKILNSAGFKIENVTPGSFYDNYYVVYNSLRYKYSNMESRNKVNKNYTNNASFLTFLIKGFEKLSAAIMAYMLTCLGILFKQSEHLTVYCSKG